MYGLFDNARHPSDEDGGLWESGEAAVPPVIGRIDPYTGRPALHYDTDGEVADEADRPVAADEWETDDGVNVTITF